MSNDFSKYDCQNEFPREHSMALSYIASDAKWTRYSAENITRHVNLLRIIPGFETKAEDVLASAETALVESLLAVRLAKSAFQQARQPVAEAAE